MDKKRTLFLTGITGALGKEILKELLETTEDILYLLVRRRNQHSHWDRVRKILTTQGLERFLGTRVHVLEGDVTLPALGLSTAESAGVRQKITHVFHIAALTALNGSERDCMQINLEGTRNMLTFAASLQRGDAAVFKRFYYFSTAYASGSLQTWHAREDELPREPVHANFYESSKFAAETLVREAMQTGFPATIFRPSIVVGHSKTGEVSDFNVIYPFIKLFAHGILKKLPSKAENGINLVPVDFVVKSALAIASQEDTLGKTFHLVTEEPPTIGMLLEVTAAEYPHMPRPEVIDPESFDKDSLSADQQFIYAILEPYLGYLNDNLTFDTQNTRAALLRCGISFPKTDMQFLKVLIEFAIKSGYLLVS